LTYRDILPELAALAKLTDLRDDGADVGYFLSRLRHETGDRAAVTGDLDFFTARDAIKEPRQMRLGLVSAYGFHDIPLPIRLVDFGQSITGFPV